MLSCQQVFIFSIITLIINIEWKNLCGAVCLINLSHHFVMKPVFYSPTSAAGSLHMAQSPPNKVRREIITFLHEVSCFQHDIPC